SSAVVNKDGSVASRERGRPAGAPAGPVPLTPAGPRVSRGPRTIKGIAALVLLSGLLPVGVARPESSPAVEPYPLEYWALREVIDRVQVSPDGRRLGLMKIPSRDGNPIIEVYDASDLSKEPFRMNADPMEIR